MRSTVYHIAVATEFNLRTLAGHPDDRVPAEAELATVDDAVQFLERAYRRFDDRRPTLTPSITRPITAVRSAPS